jgi:hypothetical protein
MPQRGADLQRADRTIIIRQSRFVAHRTPVTAS